jgi:hypothetical protein
MFHEAKNKPNEAEMLLTNLYTIYIYIYIYPDYIANMMWIPFYQNHQSKKAVVATGNYREISLLRGARD